MPKVGSQNPQAKNAGSWKVWSKFWAKHNGSWKRPQFVFVKSGGSWVEVWNEKPSVSEVTTNLQYFPATSEFHLSKTGNITNYGFEATAVTDVGSIYPSTIPIDYQVSVSATAIYVGYVGAYPTITVYNYSGGVTF